MTTEIPSDFCVPSCSLLNMTVSFSQKKLLRESYRQPDKHLPRNADLPQAPTPYTIIIILFEKLTVKLFFIYIHKQQFHEVVHVCNLQLLTYS